MQVNIITCNFIISKFIEILFNHRGISRGPYYEVSPSFLQYCTSKSELISKTVHENDNIERLDSFSKRTPFTRVQVQYTDTVNRVS